MKEKYLVWKEWGETPLMALTRLRAAKEIPEKVPLTYAGRLDPAAEGLLLILAGEECKKKAEYTALQKTYTAEILLGVSTDSYDLLGIPSGAGNVSRPASAPDFCVLATHYLGHHLGPQSQVYPPYSSKTVAGKALHEHSREGMVIDAPTHEVALYSFEALAVQEKPALQVIERVSKLTEIVPGDFRQAETRAAWAALRESLPPFLPIVTVMLTVSSGYYVRQLAQDLGRSLGTGACLYSLKRTKVGEDSVVDL